MISTKQYAEFVAEYFANENQTERFGQAFLNKFFPEEVNSYLFHQTDFIVARDLIFEKYITEYDLFQDTVQGEPGLTVNQE